MKGAGKPGKGGAPGAPGPRFECCQPRALTAACRLLALVLGTHPSPPLIHTLTLSVCATSPAAPLPRCPAAHWHTRMDAHFLVNMPML